MTRVLMGLYATCCGLGFLLVSVFLGVTLFFLFVTAVSAVSEWLDRWLTDGGRRPVSGRVHGAA